MMLLMCIILIFPFNHLFRSLYQQTKVNLELFLRMEDIHLVVEVESHLHESILNSE